MSGNNLNSFIDQSVFYSTYVSTYITVDDDLDRSEALKLETMKQTIAVQSTIESLQTYSLEFE